MTPLAATGVGSTDDGEPPVLATLERTVTMSFDEVRRMLSWPVRDDVIAHPLNDLDILLCVSQSAATSFCRQPQPPLIKIILLLID